MKRAFLAKIVTRFLNFEILNFCNNKTNKKIACSSDVQIRVTIEKNCQLNYKGIRIINFVQEQQTCPSLEGSLVHYGTFSCKRFLDTTRFVN